MSNDAHLNAVRGILAEIADIDTAAGLLSWDQETYMPKGAVEGRSTALATLARLSHERLVADELGEQLDALAAVPDLDPDVAALVRVTKKDRDRAVRIPARLVEELAAASSLALAAWQAARAERRFVDFVPHLERLIDLKRQIAAARGFADRPFDALLDDYESGTTSADLEVLFSSLEAALSPMVRAVIDSGVTVDVSPVARAYDVELQREFSLDVARAMGFDFDTGRLDRAPHPFCQKIHHGDVRLTWRADPNDLRPALYGIIHEAGHGLYEQGLRADWARTPLGDATSLGVHESQSRLWENMIARSRPFWTHFLPRLKERVGASVAGLDVESIYRAVNEVRPSFIRVEADELTYNLHVLLRFRIERDLFGGTLAIRDLPEAWNDGMERLLGIRPAHDADGVLQDIHWAMGAFGYFPTYTLGNLYAAQLCDKARIDLGDLDGQIARGELMPLREWLRERVHAVGRQLEAKELIEAATGAPPSTEPFLRYARAKFGEIYGF